MITPDRATFRRLAERGNLIALTRRLMSDQLTPVLGYRRLVLPDERTAPSFLFESVETGGTVGRYSFLGAQPSIEVLAHEHQVTVLDHLRGEERTFSHENPLFVPQELTGSWMLATVDGTDGGTALRAVTDSPALRAGVDADSESRQNAHGSESRATSVMPHFTGGWVGYAGYDTVRYLEPEKLPFNSAPHDDRHLPDMHFGLYRQMAVFDHVAKVLYAVHHVLLDEHDSTDAAYDAGCAELERFVHRLESNVVPIPPGSIDLDLSQRPGGELRGNVARTDFEHAVRTGKEYIAAGDAFQIVISQRFERETTADPFETYRALRIVNPSPYMIYLQSKGSILVASSPEILCRVEGDLVTNRPLAGTRRRGMTVEEDRALERELLADEKERAEHVMLVDLGRNDLGRVCALGSIALERIMEVEHYSHVMHLSSTVTGRLRAGLSCWDALRNTLPVGTVSGAPKVRAMQIIDELEPTRRGPYAGGIGCVSFTGDMDIALALRTMVIPTETSPPHSPGLERGTHPTIAPSTDTRCWSVHLQAGAGIVADSDPAAEYEEKVNKAAALGRAIDLAEAAFRPIIE
jgi:anthranilate synthase component I